MTKRDRLLASISRKRESISNLRSQVHELESEVQERLDALAPLVSPVSVGDRLLFERRKSGGRIGYGYRSKPGPDRWMAECWEVTKIGARTHGRSDFEDDPIDLHWTARLKRIRKDGTDSKGSDQSLYCREGYMSVPHLYDEFKIGGKAATRGLLEIRAIRKFRIEPAAEVER